MVTKPKLRSARKLIRSKMYVLVTDKEAITEASFNGFSGIMMIHSVKMVVKNLEKLLAKWTKEQADGRNEARRTQRRPNKS